MNQLQAVYNAILAHPLLTISGWWIFSNIVLTMPPPDAQSGKAYKWGFGFLHGLAGAIPRVASNFLPPGSWLYKLLAGGNGFTNGATSSTSPAKVDGAPPKP